MMCLAAALLVPFQTHSATASCDAIPAARTEFRGVLGSASRPYARPGDWVELRLDSRCDGLSSGFVGSAADHFVTLVFMPPEGSRQVVVLGERVPNPGQLRACREISSGEVATFSRTDVAGLPVVERVSRQILRFRFPDTDRLVGTAADDLTLTGPVRIAVSAAADPLPCDLMDRSCAQRPNLRACVDNLLASDGTCERNPAEPFSSFTALPPPNDYSALCDDPIPPCTSTQESLRVAVDEGGNLLIPMDWRGVLVDRDAVPVARLLRGSSGVEAFFDLGLPLLVSN